MKEIERREQIISPWVTLVEHVVVDDTGVNASYHSIKQADYVSVLGVTADGNIPLVQQFRPALGRQTLELPSGLLENNETPQDCALRELIEETGFSANDWELTLLGVLQPDTGRLENKLWCFYASNIISVAGWKPEPEIKIHMVDSRELIRRSLSGEFHHALHVAVVGLALMSGLLK